MKYFVVDAFTDRRFGGNPAAVVILDKPLADDRLQAIAAEFNLSETAFLRGLEGQRLEGQNLEERRPDQGRWSLRWFTPKVEVELCGHATLASAHALWRELGEPGGRLVFSTLSGDLTVRRDATEGADGNLVLEFPARTLAPATLPAELLDKLRLQPLAVVRAGNKCLIEVASPDAVRDYRADAGTIMQLPDLGLILTAKNSSEEFSVDGKPADFVSRVFVPAVGIPEDPVTGAAHCVLGPYWSAKLGKSELTAKQISERGGVLQLRVTDERVFIGGQAVTVMNGELRAH